jgi:serine/threonine-protein kinase HipA
MNTLKVDEKQQQNMFSKMEKALPKWLDVIDESFLSEDFKEQYKSILLERINRLK